MPWATEKAALRAARALRRELGEGAGKTIEEALDAYEIYMRHE